MNNTLSDTDRHAIDYAATLLDQLGRIALNPIVGIRCLAAAELLGEAGAVNDPAALPEELLDERTTLDEVLRLLGSLDNEVLDDDRLLEAMQHALFAHWATR
jgi:hypothetical protein